MTKFTIFSVVAGIATLAQAVQLTNEAFDLTPGEPFTIEWTDAQGPVSLTLKSGPPDALVTVQEITSGQTGESFTWTVPSDLAGQYAFEIQDGSGEPNYSIQFPIDGDGTAVVPTSGGASASSVASIDTLSPVISAPSSVHESTTHEVISATSTHETSVMSYPSAPSSSHASDTETEHETTETVRPSTTRAIESETEEPSPTESDEDSEVSRIPDNGAAGRSSGALFGLLAALALVA